MSMAIARAKYTGDPGLFGDIFKGIGRAATSFIPFVGPQISQTLFPRQPPQPTAGPGSIPLSQAQFRLATPGQKAGYLGLSGAARSAFTAQTSAQQETFFPGLGQVPAPGFVAAAQRAVPGGATGMMAAPSMNGRAGGYHVNKSDYFLKSGEYIPAGSRWVKDRKRNPANARATSRAISRVTSAKRYAKSLGRITIRKKC